MKFFSIFFYIGLPFFILLIGLYFYVGGIEELFDYYGEVTKSYNIYPENIDSFTVHKHFYLLIFFSIFFTIWGGLMSGKIKTIYMPLILGGVFGIVGYHSETVRFGFYFASAMSVIMFFVFYSALPLHSKQLGILGKIKQKKLEKFKSEAIEKSGEFVEIITDYSLKINNRPAQVAIYKTIHPLTGENFLAHSSKSFDPYFSLNVPKNIRIFFDKYNKKKYYCEIEK